MHIFEDLRNKNPQIVTKQNLKLHIYLQTISNKY